MLAWAGKTIGVLLWLALASAEQSSVLTRARELVKAGRKAEAEQVLTAAIQAGEDTPEVHGELGSLLYQSGRFGAAWTELGRAVQLEPSSTLYSMRLAGALIGDGRYPVAVEFLNAVRTRFENLPEYQYNAGMAYFGVHAYGDSAAAFRRAIELAPGMDLAHFFLGNTYAVTDELQKATREYREALRLNPRNAAYCFALGKVLGRMDLEPEALRWLRKALEIKPGDVASEFELGRICERKGDVACARPLLEDVAARYPDLLAAHYALSRIYTKLQLTEKAARENAQVRRILAAQPRRTATKAVPDPTEELPVPTPGPERP